MTPLRLALLLSLALHAGLLVALPDRPLRSDGHTGGPTVLELVLTSSRSTAGAPGEEESEPTGTDSSARETPAIPSAAVASIAAATPARDESQAAPEPRTTAPRSPSQPERSPMDPAGGVAPTSVPAQVAGDLVLSGPVQPVSMQSAAVDPHGAERDYKRALEAEIARNKRYPRMARRLGQEGTVEVGFVILRDGQLSDVRVVKGSGHAPLDRAAVDTLERLGRFQPIPPELGRESWNLVVPMSYDLL